MNISKELGFLVSVLLSAFIFHLVEFDNGKVALARFDTALQQERWIKDEITRHCSTLTPKQNTPAEKFFATRFPVRSDSTSAKSCTFRIETTSDSRFDLREFWNFGLQVQTEDSFPFLEKTFPIEFPRPLCLLPLAIFLLALFFDIKLWTIGWTVGSYLLLLGGMNFVRSTEFCLRTSWLTLRTDQTFLGLLLMVLWFSLHRSRPSEPVIVSGKTHPFERILNRMFATSIGLWNPAVYTVGGRFLLPFRGTLSKIEPFLDSQFVIFGLSLYLFTIDFRNPLDGLEKSLALPRYFSFTALLLLAVTYWTDRPRPQVLVWRQPRIGRALLLILGVEAVAWKLSLQAPMVLKIGLAMALSELSAPRGIQRGLAARRFFQWGGALFLVSFLVVASHEAGVIDLALVILQPKIHPNSVVFFTFFAGLGLGFVTGNLSASFFALFPMMRSHEPLLVRAALLDGLLAGTLLSPFSIFNLFTASQFNIPLRDLVAFRFRRLSIPLSIGAAIYAVSAFNSVAILRPVTFIFLCLVVLCFQLRRSAWYLRPVVDPLQP